VYPALGFRGWYALYPVHPRFVFEYAIHVLTADSEDDLLVTARTAFVTRGYFNPPAFVFAETGVHPEQVSGKNGGFVTTGTTPDFHDGVFTVFGIGRYQQQFDGFFQFREFVLGFFLLLFGHLSEIGIVFRCQ